MQVCDPSDTLKRRFTVLADNPQQLACWVDAVRPSTSLGHLPQYIAQLAVADPNVVAIAVQGEDGALWTAGDQQIPFTLMSVMKPFLLLYMLEEFGRDYVFQVVGTQPSDQPFHSLKQLAADRGFPRNPMINSGAITLASMLPGNNGSQKCEFLRRWLNRAAGVNLVLDRVMVESVRSLPNDSNRAIAQVLQQSGAVPNLEIALDAYNQLCCLRTDVAGLAKIGLLLASLQQSTIKRQSQRIVNSIMLGCGVYEASSDWAVEIGLPVKTGVSGTVLAIVPQQGAIAIYAPAIDDVGNSVAGRLLLEKIVQELDLGIF
jgi:glutaminase